MEPNYTLRAADGKEYGPASLEHLTGWIREGRVGPQTEIRRSDMEHWAPAASFVEFQELFPAPAATPPAAAPAPPAGPAARPVVNAAPVAGSDPEAVARMRAGASWFFWIAGLSLVNSVVALAGMNWRFIFGLGVTQVFDALASNLGGAGKGIAFALDLVVAGIFVLFGVFAGKRQLWAFIAGLSLFAIDTVLMLVFQDWISLAFHGYVIFRLFTGLQACRQLKAS